jgi:hypothetical protein
METRLLYIVTITRLDQLSSKTWHIVCQSLAIQLVLRVFSTEYILAVMAADKSNEKLQRMEGFTSRSDSI